MRLPHFFIHTVIYQTKIETSPLEERNKDHAILLNTMHDLRPLSLHTLKSPNNRKRQA